jgi:fructose-1,6-bisphosphatase I
MQLQKTLLALCLHASVALQARGGTRGANALQAATLEPPTRASPTAPVFDQVCKETGITLSRFMIETAIANPELSELESIFSSIETATKTISNLVRRSSLTGLTGYLDDGNINIQGEEQKKLDVITNDVLKNALRFTGRMGVLASEEEDVPVEVEDESAARYQKEVLVEQTSGKYVAVFDPLDGSSNVDAGIPTGTIFGIFEDNNAECEVVEGSDVSDECLKATLQAGRNLVASGYVLYSSATHLFMTLGAGTYGFTYDEHIGEFVLSHPDVKIPARGKIYSTNEANRWEWDQPLQDYVTAIQKGEGESQTKYSARYIGSMVGDVHRTLLYGGIFGYAADTKNKAGKLRLLYEAAPMAFLVEQAGGIATTGRDRIMDIEPSNVHQRVPCILGSADDVNELKSYYAKTDKSADIYQG